MKCLTALLLLCLVSFNVYCEPMKHPVTGEDGFWVSRPEMELTVLGLQERDLLKEANITLDLKLDVATGTIAKLEKNNKTLWVVVGIEGIAIGGLALWKLLSP